MAIEYDLKKKLDKIIDYAYKDDPKKEKYKWFKLNVLTRKMKSKSGDYNIRTHAIRIVDTLDTKEGNNISTLLHEVSHHIDWVMHGKTGHKKDFYEVFATLIYAALDLNFVDCYDLRNMDFRNSDYNKVQKILDNYVPHRQNNVQETYQVKVFNSYSQKDELSQNGYFWNKISKSWDKDNLNKEEVEYERYKLKQLGFTEKSIKVVDSSKFNFSDFRSGK